MKFLNIVRSRLALSGLALSGLALSGLALGSLLLLGVWAAPTLAEEDATIVAYENVPLSTLASQVGLPVAPLGSSESSDEVGPVHMAGCYTQECGNTGTKYGYGGNCNDARDDLEDRLDAASYIICPGTVIAVDINYGTCSPGGI